MRCSTLASKAMSTTARSKRHAAPRASGTGPSYAPADGGRDAHAVAPGGTGRARAHCSSRVAPVSSEAGGAADLLSGAQRGLATKIAREWNTKDAASGHVGHVLRFSVDAAYARRFSPHRVGGAGIDELWVPAEELDEFNDHIVGLIERVATYRSSSKAKAPG